MRRPGSASIGGVPTRQCRVCLEQHSVRSFYGKTGRTCHGCRKRGAPPPVVAKVDPVEEKARADFDAFSASVRELAGCPRRAG